MIGRTLGTIAAAVLAASAGAQANPTMDAAIAAYDQGDYVSAVTHLRVAADAGDINGVHNLGHMYLTGRGVAPDAAQAARWFRLGAENGNPHSKMSLGYLYAQGLGVARDDNEAVRWYRSAALQGEPHAQGALAVMTARGRGTPADTVEAYAWASIADAQGNTIARIFNALLASDMTPAQIERAQVRGREYLARYARATERPDAPGPHAGSGKPNG